ncbi:hypothetical protein BN1708_020169, partial [Verticillium longisporum]
GFLQGYQWRHLQR